MKILIGADLVPTESNFEYFAAGDVEALVGEELKGILDEADYRIFNLEVPLCDRERPIPKCGPNLIAPTQAANAYTAMGVNLLTLANNHTFDQDEQGLLSTFDTLKKSSIDYLGAGHDLAEAAKPYFIDFAGKRIGIYACCEHEFGIATETSAGANPFDPLESPDHILKLKKECDYVIVLYHGGKEHYRYPSPMLQKTCRKMVEKGADLIVCQHSHCIGCQEKYRGGTIVYGQGNFLFDRSMDECWQTSLLVAVDEDMDVSYIPLRKHGSSVRLAIGEDRYQIMQAFHERGEEIRQDGFVEAQYKEFASSMAENYLFLLSGMKRTFLFRVFNKLTGHHLAKWLLKRKCSNARKLVVQNFIECEAHRELMVCALKDTCCE